MIHRIVVTPETDVAELKKLVRKKLMTGGAVLRLDESAEAKALEKIFQNFLPGAEAWGIQAEVLGEIAKHPSLTPDLAAELQLLSLPPVTRALELRAGRARALCADRIDQVIEPGSVATDAQRKDDNHVR